MAAEYLGSNAFEQTYDINQSKTKAQVKTHVVSLSRIEKVVYLVLIALIATVSMYMLSLKYEAYQTTVNIANTQSKIVHQQSVNSELNSEAMKQSSYERIASKARSYGLSLNNDNVKVVQKDGSN